MHVGAGTPRAPADTIRGGSLLSRLNLTPPAPETISVTPTALYSVQHFRDAITQVLRGSPPAPRGESIDEALARTRATRHLHVPVR